MTRRNRAKSSSLFLMELILAILFFSVASAVCVQFFVKSHLLSQDARALERSVNEVSAVAELIKTSDNTKDALAQIQSQYSNTDSVNDTELVICYDKNFLNTSAEDAVYSLDIILLEEETMMNAVLSMSDTKNHETIYSLDLSHHIQRGDGNE